MRIGIFGNTNNYPFVLAQAFRKLGYDVMLVVNRKDLLHRPESMIHELSEGYPDWILDCSHISEDEFIIGSVRISEVINFLSAHCDGLILNDIGPSLAEYVDLPSVAFMTGSDITYYADYESLGIRTKNWSPDYKESPGGRYVSSKWRSFVTRQRRGLRYANGVSTSPPGLVPEIDLLLADIGVDDKKRFFIYMSTISNEISEPFSDNGRLRILNGARLNWVRPLPLGFSRQDHKGTDVLIRGFYRFIMSGGDARLVLIRKGLHVAQTERLVEELELERYVEWMDELSLSDFYSEIAMSDIVCDQLGDSFPGMVALDSMAIGRPVIANFRPEFLGRNFPDGMVGYHASNEYEVASHLEHLSQSSEFRREAGLAAREFYEKYLTPEYSAAQCLRYLGIDRVN